MKIRPFKALRPRPQSAKSVAAVPYDVVNTAEAKALAAGNAESFLHVSRPEIDMPEGTPCSSPEAYRQARVALDRLRETGVLLQDDAPTYYAYRQVMGNHAQTGIVATFDTQEYLTGILKQHEKTRTDKEDDRTRHIEILNAHTGPAFLTYKDDAAIDAIVSEACVGEPLADFVADDGIRHTVWEIARVGEGSATHCRADELEELFARVPAAYIADGHHRSAAASRYAKMHDFAGESRWFMAVIFPASQLKILPYNRLIADLNGLSEQGLLAKAREIFRVTEVSNGTPEAGRNARMYLQGQWWNLAWDVPAGTDVVSSLDVSVLQDRFLKPVLGIDDPRTSPRISFVGGIRGTGELEASVKDGSAAVAFSMYPVTVGEMMDIADAGAIMPPKSTWFEPKLRSGLFVHVID